MLFGADRACGVDRSVERDAHHEGVVERREDVRDAEHVLAVARVGHVGLNLLHDRGGDLLFFFSLRESTTMWMSRLADVPGSVAGGSIEAREDGPRGGVDAGARAHDAHHDCLLVSDASGRRTDVRGPDDRAAAYLFSSHRYFSSRRASGLFGADEEPRPRGDAFIIPFHPRSDRRREAAPFRTPVASSAAALQPR
jgi:hypothetical protein